MSQTPFTPPNTQNNRRFGAVALILFSLAAWPVWGAPVYGRKVQGTRALNTQETAEFHRLVDAQKLVLRSRIQSMTRRKSLARRIVERLQRPANRAINQALSEERALGQMILGAPSPIENENADESLLAYPRYTSLYSRARGIQGSNIQAAGARWVAFVTTPEDVEHDYDRPKAKAWSAETGVPENFPVVDNERWKGLFRKTSTRLFRRNSDMGDENGLTRGHMADSGASGFSEDEMLSTYTYLSNGLPQYKSNNAGAWHTLEQDNRAITLEGQRYAVHQFAGPIDQAYTYQKLNGESVTIEPKVEGDNIAVPTAFWKVALALPFGVPVPEAMADARAISIIVPNAPDDELMASDWTRFTTTASRVQELTGLSFFRNLPEAIRQPLLNHQDNREGFTNPITIPDWKVRELNTIARRGGAVAEVAGRLLANGVVSERPRTGLLGRRSGQYRPAESQSSQGSR